GVAGGTGVTGAGVAGAGATAAIVWLAQGDTRSTRVKMPGTTVLQLRSPRLVMPTSTTDASGRVAIAGPPLSPLHVPTAKLVRSMAQNSELGSNASPSAPSCCAQ